MKFGIVSDVHGNKVAWEAIKRDAAQKGNVDQWVSLGDNIGYMPWPNEVMDDMWDLTDKRVAGNHEDFIWLYVSLLQQGQNLPHQIPGINPLASAAFKWTTTELNDENKQRLEDLVNVPRILTGKDFGLQDDLVLFTHGQPKSPEMPGLYIENKQHAFDYCFGPKNIVSRFNFVGHTHLPQVYTFSRKNMILFPAPVGGEIKSNQDVDLSDATQSLVVVPGAGQPRDKNPETGYAVFDTDTEIVSIRRLPYDIDAVANEMQQRPGFPQLPGLWERLYRGA